MIKLKPHLDGIIFDMDGTIIDTERVWETAMDNLLHRHGIDPTPAREHEVFEQMVGRGLPQSIELLVDAFKIPHVNHKDLARSVIEDVKLMVKEGVQFIHGFETFHNKLSAAGIPSSIATNCDIESLEEIVKKMSFNTYFGENIYCVAHVDHKAKPDPALFLHAAEKIGAQPGRCIVFEDSFVGFKAAASAGMKCIAIQNRNNASFHAQHTHGFIDSYDHAEDAITHVIKKIESDKR